jgi:hypothetical protein
MGRVDLIVNPSIPPVVTKYDEKFFNCVAPGDQVVEELAFLLNPLSTSKLLPSLNIFFCDTVVVNKGVVSYYLFNTDAGKGPLRVINKPNQLIFPVLTTYFVKRRALLYNRVAKKEPEFTNISHFFDIVKPKQKSPYVGSIIEPFYNQQSGTFITEANQVGMAEEDMMMEVEERDSEHLAEGTNDSQMHSLAGPPMHIGSTATLTAEFYDGAGGPSYSPGFLARGQSVSIKEVKVRPNTAGSLFEFIPVMMGLNSKPDPSVSAAQALASPRNNTKATKASQNPPQSEDMSQPEQRQMRNARDDTPNFAYYKMNGSRLMLTTRAAVLVADRIHEVLDV